MTPVLIGYFPKRTVKRPDWLQSAGVEEVCSVSTCISEGPDDWIDQWRHNEMFVYDTPELAWSVVPQDVRDEFELYAYRLFPVQFVEGQQRVFDVPPLQVQGMSPSFECLGYDVVSRSGECDFDCSPLSCNYMAKRVPTNRHCLLDEAGTAFHLANVVESGGGEPGPYYVVEVWRQKTPEQGC